MPDRSPASTARSARRGRSFAAIGALAWAGALGGCVERVVSITSEPPGALVLLNDREIGRTPVEARFVHYGTFDVRLAADGYEPVHDAARARPPLWDVPPLDLLAEIAPIPFRSRTEWHYVLEPAVEDPAALEARARELRTIVEAEAAEAAAARALRDGDEG